MKSAVMPDLLYGSVAFSGCLRQDQRSHLQVQQNRAARAVFGLPPRTSAQPLLARLQLYGIEELHKQKTLIMIWRCSNGRASNAQAQSGPATTNSQKASRPMPTGISQLPVMEPLYLTRCEPWATSQHSAELPFPRPYTL